MTTRQWLLGGMLLAIATCADPGTGPDTFPDGGIDPDAGTGPATGDDPAGPADPAPDIGRTMDSLLIDDGVEWRLMLLREGLAPLYDVWVSSAEDVFAVGSSRLWECCGTILHFDGTYWSFMRGPSPSTMAWLTDVWGTSSTDVFAVGDGILHYDGSEWRKMSSPSGERLHGVWRTASDDVYAAGAGGVILHYDGIHWSAINAPPRNGDLLGIWGNSGGDVFAVKDMYRWGPEGCCSDVLHYDGVSWTVQSGMSGQSLDDVWTTPEQVFIVWSGPTIIRGIR